MNPDRCDAPLLFTANGAPVSVPNWSPKYMRLKTINPRLSDLFPPEKDLIAAREIYEKIFWVCFDALEGEIKQIVSQHKDIEPLGDRNLPTNGDFETLRDHFDDEYLDSMNSGEGVVAMRFFKLARITASIAIQANARHSEDYAEAAYEAVMASEYPAEFIFGE